VVALSFELGSENFAAIHLIGIPSYGFSAQSRSDSPSLIEFRDEFLSSVRGASKVREQLGNDRLRVRISSASGSRGQIHRVSRRGTA